MKFMFKNSDLHTLAGMLFWRMFCENCDINEKYNLPKDQGFPLELDVVLTVNGAEVNYVETMNKYIASFNEQVEERAVELLKEKFNKTYSLVDELHEELQYELKRVNRD